MGKFNGVCDTCKREMWKCATIVHNRRKNKMKYKVTLALKEYYELEIEADDYESAVLIAQDTDIAEFNETGMTTEQFNVEELTND